MNSIIINQETKQRILELYLCSNDNRMRVIAEICKCSAMSVSNIIQEYYDKKIEFERGNFTIYHSSINNF